MADSDQPDKDEKHLGQNVSAQHFDKVLNDGKTSDSSSEKSEALQELRNKEVSSGTANEKFSGSAKDAEDTPIKYGGEEETPKKGGRFRSRRAKLGLGLGGGGLAFTILGLVLSSALGIFINLKEIGSDWSTKHSRHSHMYRTSKVKAIRYFSNPDTCGAVAVKCKLKSGISDKEISKLREAGFDIKESDIKTSSNGKKYLSKLRIEDKRGRSTVVTSADDFARQYRTNPRVLAKFEKVASTRSLVWRGKQSLKKLASFGVKRSAVVGSGAQTEEDMTKAFRQEVYGGGEEGVTNVGDGSDQEAADAEEEDRKAKGLQALNELDGELADQVNDIKANLIANGPTPDLVFDASQLGSAIDPRDAAKKAASSLGGKATVMGALGAIDTTCVVYKYLARLSYLSKLLKAAALIKYAGIFMVAADAAKSGEITPTQAAYIGGILMRPSVSAASKGKTFSDSAGWTLITQGKVGDMDGLGRFTNATPTLSMIQNLKKEMSLGGDTASFCKKQQSWWGQTITIVGGLGITLVTGGLGTLVGIIGKSVVAGLFFSVIGNYITPLILQYATGAIVPDPETDPEGGFGAGNALAAGLGAMGSQVGRGQGMRPIKDDEFAGINVASTGDERLYAQVDELNGEASAYTRAMDKLAVAILPLSQSLASLNPLAFMQNSATLVGASQAQLVSPYSGAAQDNYRDDLCNDEDYGRLGLSTDAFCNPIYAQSDEDVLAAKYDPEATIDYLLGGGHIDDNGTPSSDEFQNFIDVCINGADPLVSDGNEAELVGAEDTTMCDENNEKYQHFRFFIQDTDILDGDDAAVNDTLGIGEGTVVTGTSGAGSNLKIASFNVLGKSHSPGDYEQRMDKSIGIINNEHIDIVGFQEFQQDQRKYFLSKMSDWELYAIGPRRGDNSIGWDKTKFTAIEKKPMENLNYFSGSTLHAPMVKLKDNSTDQEFYVLNTHDPTWTENEGYRVTNAKQHLKKVKELSAASGLPVFLTGDFNSGFSLRYGTGNDTLNDDPDNLSYCILTRDGTLQNAFDLQENRKVKCPNQGNDNAVDHVYFTQGVELDKYYKIAGGKNSNGSDVHATHIAGVRIPGAGSGVVGDWTWPVPVKWWKSNRADFLEAHSANSGTWTSGINRLATDISVPPDGTPVYAMLGGKVTRADLGGHGLIISSEVQGGTLQIAYAHGPRTNQNTTYAAGDVIMKVGALGENITGGHLHIDMSFTKGGVKKGVCAQDVFLAIGAGKEPDLAALTSKAAPPCGRS